MTRRFLHASAKVVSSWLLLVLLFWITDCTAIDDKNHYFNAGEYYNLRGLKRTSSGGSSSSSGYRSNDVDADGEGSNAIFVLFLLVLFGGVPLACWCQCKLIDMAIKDFMKKIDKEEEEVKKDIREFRSWKHEGLRPTDGLYMATYYAGAVYTGCIFCEKRKEIKGTQQVVLKFEEANVGRGWSVTGHGRDHDGDFTITRGLCSPSGKIYWAEEGNGNRLNKHVLITGSLQLATRKGNLRFQVAGDDFGWSLENFSYVGPPIAQGDSFPPIDAAVALVSKSSPHAPSTKATSDGNALPASLVAVTFRKDATDAMVGIRLGRSKQDPSQTVIVSIEEGSIIRKSSGGLLLCPDMCIVAINNQRMPDFRDYINYLKQAQGLITIVAVAGLAAEIRNPLLSRLVTATVTKSDGQTKTGLKIHGNAKTRELTVKDVGNGLFSNTLLANHMNIFSINNVPNLPNAHAACSVIRDAPEIVTVVAWKGKEYDSKEAMVEDTTERTSEDESNRETTYFVDV